VDVKNIEFRLQVFLLFSHESHQINGSGGPYSIWIYAT
jgi:hypothetical protein